MVAPVRSSVASRSSLPSFSLLPGERVIASGAPDPSTVRQLDGSALLCTVLCMLVPLPLLPFWMWANRAYVRRHRYWLTDRRLVVQTGMIGQSVRSVPLDRIADVEVVASWWDRLFGVQHVLVRDMTGEVAKGGVSSGFRLFAVADATAWASRILGLVGHGRGVLGPEGPEGLADDAALAELRRIAALLADLRDAA